MRAMSQIFEFIQESQYQHPLNVNVLIETEGNVLIRGDEIRTIEIPSGHNNKTLDIVTVNDQVAGSWGMIRATVITGTGYHVGSDFTDSVKVLDNDLLQLSLSMLMNHQSLKDRPQSLN